MYMVHQLGRKRVQEELNRQGYSALMRTQVLSMEPKVLSSNTYEASSKESKSENPKSSYNDSNFIRFLEEATYTPDCSGKSKSFLDD